MNLSTYFVTPDGAGDDLVRAAIRGGASVVQIRDKTASDDDLAARVARLLPVARAAGVPLIVNDRLAVVLATGADGLHIGQGDGDPREMRNALPPRVLLGLSIETEDQLAAMPPGIDYIGAGPVRATQTKPDHAAPIGFDGLSRIAKASPVPTVAIGGLGPEDTAAVKASGAAGMAVVSAIAAAPDPEAATRNLARLWSAP